MSDAYDAFLFESLGVEENGMDLSVLSALARAGVDPWAEAKRLAALPRQAAVAAIAALLGLASDNATARRLAELLPRSAVSQTLPAKMADIFRKYGLLMIVAWLAASVVFMMVTSDTHPVAPATVSAGAPAVR
jgi:hypothetical protein